MRSALVIFILLWFADKHMVVPGQFVVFGRENSLEKFDGKSDGVNFLISPDGMTDFV